MIFLSEFPFSSSKIIQNRFQIGFFDKRMVKKLPEKSYQFAAFGMANIFVLFYTLCIVNLLSLMSFSDSSMKTKIVSILRAVLMYIIATIIALVAIKKASINSRGVFSVQRYTIWQMINEILFKIWTSISLLNGDRLRSNPYDAKCFWVLWMIFILLQALEIPNYFSQKINIYMKRIKTIQIYTLISQKK